MTVIANFDRYLENTSIYEYNNEINYRLNPNYGLIINDFKFHSKQSFFEYIDIFMNNFGLTLQSNDIVDKLDCIFQFILNKDSTRKDSRTQDNIRTVFKNTKTFLISFIKDNLYNTTDGKNFYNSIGNDYICNNLFKRNNSQISKIRETRNKFIEHGFDCSIRNGFDFRRNVILQGGGDNYIGRVNLQINIISLNMIHNFSIAPLLDFCVFLDEIKQIL